MIGYTSCQTVNITFEGESEMQKWFYEKKRKTVKWKKLQLKKERKKSMQDVAYTWKDSKEHNNNIANNFLSVSIFQFHLQRQLQ